MFRLGYDTHADQAHSLSISAQHLKNAPSSPPLEYDSLSATEEMTPSHERPIAAHSLPTSLPNTVSTTPTSTRWLSAPIDKLRGRLQRLGSYNNGRGTISNDADLSDTAPIKMSKDDNIILRNSSIQSWQSHVSLPDWVAYNDKENMTVSQLDQYDYTRRQHLPLQPRINTPDLMSAGHRDGLMPIHATEMTHDVNRRSITSQVELTPASTDYEQSESNLGSFPSPALSACPSLDLMDVRPTGIHSSSSSIHSVLSLPSPLTGTATAACGSLYTPEAIAQHFNPTQLNKALVNTPSTGPASISTGVSSPRQLPLLTISVPSPTSAFPVHAHNDNIAGQPRLTDKLVFSSPVLEEKSTPPSMLREHSLATTTSSSDSATVSENHSTVDIDAPFPTTRYRPVRQLGSGSFASVWLAHDKLDNYRKVAIKVVTKKAEQPTDTAVVVANVERARREASLLRTLNHPNIVKIFDEFETEDVFCLTLEYANAGDLFDWVTREHNETTKTGSEFEQVVRDIFGQLLHSLLYLHSQHVIHRDIKLENVLLESVPVTEATPSGLRVILADFGLAITHVPRGEQPLMAGSDEYAAPEAILQSAMSASAPVVSPTSATSGYDRCKTDVWSLGVVLFALLYGRLPFLRKAGQTRRSFLYRVAQGDVSFPSDIDISNAAADIVRALLRRKPGDRLSLNEVRHMSWVQDYVLPLAASF
ncbi:kinase-like domain-containing protein [Syncephalis fuscata]|nr:kinase-like domain-containing protein [Syncephalis fuscata]